MVDSISNWLGALTRRVDELEQQREADSARIAALEAYVAGVERECGVLLEEVSSDAA